ncbi:MAG: 50S ribosomal protein L35ae [Nanoarchaeota archaeon]|nr:50S ribosomal protein L35ae [Nanoarchaeota archaeon]
MEGVIMNFRGGRHTQYDNQMIMLVDGVDSKEKSNALIGKKVVWSSPAKKEIKGLVKSAHGCKGALRVLFEKGMPGQSIGQKVKIE